jgi:nitrogen fixation protein NifU and related proteins
VSADAWRDESVVYTDVVVEHATRPRNVGVLDGAHGIGTEGNPVYGNQVRIYVRLGAAGVEAVRFKALGCSATIAAASMATVLAEGQSVAVARGVGAETIQRALGGLPPEKQHCAAVAAGALQRALDRCATAPVHHASARPGPSARP